MSTNTTLGVRLVRARPTAIMKSVRIPRRKMSSAVVVEKQRQSRRPQAVTPPASTGTSSSFFTPSLCRTRQASTTTASDSPSTSPSTALDWNTFFRMRTVRRRYALTSSIGTAGITTTGALYAFSEIPMVADNITQLIPADPFISIGVATFGATFLGWLIGPVFGNTIWRLSHRSRLAEFEVKERGFFERIKKHRVNPSGASTNNPVPDFYGEKVQSVAGYRRWLKDQRAFNRKRGGNYPSTV